ncbi:MAG: hypothetical protein ACOCZ8_01000 [Bacteroidota bacterium]
MSYTIKVPSSGSFDVHEAKDHHYPNAEREPLPAMAFTVDKALDLPAEGDLVVVADNTNQREVRATVIRQEDISEDHTLLYLQFPEGKV